MFVYPPPVEGGQCEKEKAMTARVAINGFGRTGRCALRSAHQRGADIEVVAINDVMDTGTMAHLLRHDSVFGRFPAEVAAGDSTMTVDGRDISVFSEADPAHLPWAELEIDVVIESTGRFRDRDEAAKHLTAGAQRVIVSAPAKQPDVTVALGVNFNQVYDAERHRIISNASCTTNCLAPVAKVLHEAVGIRHGLMTSIHAYTSGQRLQDAPHKDLRRARAAAINLVPTSTGAATALGLVVPELDGKLHGYAMRVPIPTGSVVDLTVETERPTSADEVNDVFAGRADRDELEGILAYSEDPIVSSDIIGSPYSAIFDAGFTSVIDGTFVKVLAWYDNEWGYATRLSELAERVSAPVPPTV
jgi:glyceraldehyde 3-phosphate dehydrogenase